jgi:ribA/ribD-fused uncharacterized protein
MSNIDAGKLPAILPPDIIEKIIPMVEMQTADWHRLADQLSAEQRSQIYEVINARKRKKHKEWEETATQAEKDNMFRASAIFYARDHWFVTMHDEHDLVNGTGHFKNISLELIKESSPIGYAYETIKLRRGYMQPGEQFMVFDANAVFAPWYPATITIEGMTFSSVLHYIVYRKAEQFRDRDMMAIILSITDQEDLRELNNTVKYFEKIVWNMVLKEVLNNGYKAMFQQHEPLMSQLTATKGTTLLFADITDHEWGSGLHKDDPQINDRKVWPGKNLLGEFLTELRVILTGTY